MKKLIVISLFLLVTLQLFPQKWIPVYTKQDFRADVNLTSFRVNNTRVNSTAVNLNILYNARVTPTQFDYLYGSTGPLQGQIDLKSPILNPVFSGLIKVGTDTIATRSYARANGSGGSGGGTKGATDFMDVTGDPYNNTALSNAFTAKANITNPDFAGARVKLGADTLATRSYARQFGGGVSVDTTSLSTRINLKANITNPNFTGVVRLATNDTLATKSYARTYGGVGSLSAEDTIHLSNRINAKLSPNGSAANLTSFPVLNQNSTGYSAAVKSPTNSGVITVTGMTAGTTRIKTVRDANDTFLELGGSYTPSGSWIWTSATVTWPTFNQTTTGSAAKWTTARSIYGNNVDGSANVTSIISSTYGGTGNGFSKFVGATTSEKTYTLPDATTTILTTNSAVTVAQGGTGRSTATTAYGLVAAGTTATGAEQTVSTGSTGQMLRSGGSGALPTWSTPTFPNTAASGKFLIGDGTNYVVSAYTMPTTNGTNTYVLTTNGAGVTSWAAAAGGGGSFSTITGNWYDNTSLNTELIDSINDIDIPIVYNIQSGTNYNMVLTDKNKVVEMTSGSANTFTIVQNSSVNFPLNIPIFVNMGGSGQTTITAGTNVTIHSLANNRKIAGQYAGVVCIQRSTNVWDVQGALIP